MTATNSKNSNNMHSATISFHFDSHSESHLKQQSELKGAPKKSKYMEPSIFSNPTEKGVPLSFSAIALANIIPQNALNFAQRHDISSYGVELAFQLAQWKLDHANRTRLPPLPPELKNFNKQCKSTTEAWSDLEILVNGLIIQMNPRPFSTPEAMTIYSSRAKIKCIIDKYSILEKYFLA